MKTNIDSGIHYEVVKYPYSLRNDFGKGYPLQQAHRVSNAILSILIRK